ncbi:MAG: acetate--CoA ligase [Desulfarculaceae bacterium]|nr:acetate--CoA ligase [Desulfarculaceae bacterium]MCF8046253.1 acetate--CoA ligase [Desulfarculaceae bacterium]MCF8063654.1 acetate--CoA ligase [Desulfarculaceae bacterium]MCF8097096.1 acetate--CoA ligase [Desulfarculaceae bacterium]MCF8120964.1 acetate--CoA ligase [Desulfarculaceae bacterium]
MADDKVLEKNGLYYPPQSFVDKAHVNSFEQYQEMYKRSTDDPEGFWGEVAQEFYWEKKWDKVLEYNFHRSKGPVSIKWFMGAKTNMTYNCLDRHLETRGDQPALLWEGNEPGEDRIITYRQLYEHVCKFANVLKGFGVKKGDRVTIYLPMIPELSIAMLACARIGAIHSVVFGGFSAESLKDRIVDSECNLVITSDGTYRGGKAVTLKQIADDAVANAAKEGVTVPNLVVVERVGPGKGIECPMKEGRDQYWHDLMADAESTCEVEWMDSEDPLFILYTSGSTGKPKGVLHTTGGYMVYVSLTHKYVFDYHDGDVYWCTADIGWVTGHSYILYGPLLNGAQSLMFEGVPTYPDSGRFWDVVDKWKVNIFYTAPTAIRAVMRMGDEFVTKYSRKTLQLLGTVGEPINPEAWRWYNEEVGDSHSPIVDTWWQTETGGILITPLPGAIPTKPGSATLPFFGVQPCLLDDEGNEVEGNGVSGRLAIKAPWPGQLRTTYGSHERFETVYFSDFDGFYFTGDGAKRDEDGYYWITGRVDDVINVSGHRMGTAEVESALVSHPTVAEAAVVGFPHEIKGQGIYAYVTLKVGEEYSEQLKKDLVMHVRKEIGPIASPDVIHWAPALPKTRSGKIMRRILRKMAAGESDFGDTSTLADPSVVGTLVEMKGK